MSIPSKNDVTRRDGFVLFWSGWPSHWFRSSFVIDGVRYNCGEQWMMAEKARTFRDDRALNAILAASNPRKQKASGREVANYEDGRWRAVAHDRLYVGLLEKFRQNPELGRALLDTGTDTIVEASPLDTVWGIGLAQDDPDATRPERWRGTNWLGEVLMRVRETLR